MRKFMQWSLVSFVAVGMIAIVAHQMLTATTARTRDVSVAALEEKLRAFPVDLAPPQPVDAAPSEADVPPESVSDESSASLEALRERWAAAFQEFDDVWQECVFAPEVIEEIRESVGEEDWSIPRDELKRVTAFQDCLDDVMAEFMILCRMSAKQRELLCPGLPDGWDEIHERFRQLSDDLHVYATVKSLAGQDVPAIDALSAMYDLEQCCLHCQLREYEQVVWVWFLVERALAGGAVPDSTWDRLVAQLDLSRRSERFVRNCALSTHYRLANFEDTDLTGMDFRKYPLSYAQNWAYFNITTPLYNHDLDRFSRAMEALLDLVELPYHEAKPALDAFYEDFDVEPGVEEMKFMRQNMGWYTVIWYSRVAFVEEACRQASVDVTRLAILLEAHRRETGGYPETLGALAGGAPVNPLDGATYFYERTDEDFALGYHNPTLPDADARHGGVPPNTLWSVLERGDQER